MARAKAKKRKTAPTKRTPRREERLPLGALAQAGAPVNHHEFYVAADGWRWRTWAANGDKLGDCGQGYSRLVDARAGLEALLGTTAVVVVRRGCVSAVELRHTRAD